MRLQPLVPAQPQPVAAGRGAGAEKKQARIILAQRRIAEPGGQTHLELVDDAQVGNAKHRGTDAVEHRGLELVRSEEHTYELQSLMRISYDVFCLKRKNTTQTNKH